ncbi:MAG: tRNA (adenosine(37)-N6)-threonylcarbamoyltransferase complex transferase subunit TsaD [Chlamydiae bacterium]|nr:tRNA (adenosine(37)-N6)-threonylcarbamoyltransferase complex transferase subunit TsaD [Chlamydiota bacterium]
MITVLGIESTCDEMACSIVIDGREIKSNVISSQADIHQSLGGVWPELASRQHVDLLIPTLNQALSTAGISKEEIDLIAVAQGPGLIGSLLMGLSAAKTFSLAWNIPFVGVNHVEAHLYAAMLSNQAFTFPAIGLVISGGHTFLVQILDVGNYAFIGGTVDDAIGEAFDKVASMLEKPYPGGPAIESLAKIGNPLRYPFKAGKVKAQPWSFSFSGLKTNVLYTIHGQNCKGNGQIGEIEKADIAASFQEAAFKDIVEKTGRATENFPCKAIYIGGGVSNNLRLRELFQTSSISVPIYWPSSELTLDNGAMIAGLGYHVFRKKEAGDPLDLEPKVRMAL